MPIGVHIVIQQSLESTPQCGTPPRPDHRQHAQQLDVLLDDTPKVTIITAEHRPTNAPKPIPSQHVPSFGYACKTRTFK
ncbi:L-gulonolactone oxidase-like protein [Anopheles sinensis]|uniref:L-gulonolactone oxidase-like protein n=1 Tax=Anopheles sinensis TaxID=74873 RepID=A0A084WAV7_ANOSI|nr:L-gulonolactone oxidase-like protein [Anopheles sinensis]